MSADLRALAVFAVTWGVILAAAFGTRRFRRGHPAASSQPQAPARPPVIYADVTDAPAYDQPCTISETSEGGEDQ
jgi:hypothetical protein